MKRSKSLAIAVLLICAVSAFLFAADAARTKSSNVTFTKDVAPIIQKNCMTCHRPGEIAPMSLTSYAEVRPWAKAIRSAVISREMPPWHAESHSRAFENDARLSQKDIDTIVAWVDGGVKQGLPKDMPPNPSFVDGWTIGKPDLVLSMQEEFLVPAEGVVPYKYFVVPTNFTQDTWVQAAEIRPGNRAVVHHVIVLAREPGSGPFRDPGTGRGTRERLDSMLVGTAPGMPAFAFKPGQGKLLKAGSHLVFQVHYTPNGSPERDRSSVGLVLAKAQVERAVMTFPVGTDKFKIPPGAPNYEVRSSFTFPADARVVSVMPHMHMRGKDFKYTAVYPDGSQEVILNVPRWDFNWQQIYRFKEPVFMPKGSRIDCVAHFDNSPNNKFNPDPTKEVVWGDQTWEEMMIGYMDFVFDKPQLTPASTGENRQ